MVLVSNSDSKTIFFIAFDLVLVFKSQVRQDHEAILLVLESVSKVLVLSDLRTKNLWYWTPTEEFVVLALLASDKTQTTNSPVWVQVHVFMVHAWSNKTKTFDMDSRAKTIFWSSTPEYIDSSWLGHNSLLVLFAVLENSECAIYIYSN